MGRLHWVRDFPLHPYLKISISVGAILVIAQLVSRPPRNHQAAAKTLGRADAGTFSGSWHHREKPKPHYLSVTDP